MQYKPDDIAKITGGKLLQAGIAVKAEHIIFDSRKVTFPERSVFFAIKGERHDGHLFLKELYNKGLRIFITENPTDPGNYPDANIIEISSSITALQKLAAHHRSQFKLPVIGITGSNGKTIVKEWLYQLLQKDLHIIRNPKSYNSQIGVPLSVCRINPEHELGIFEAGISQPGEMDNLGKIIRPEIGIFTNIGPAHDEGFKNRQQKIREKLKLFSGAEVIIYSKDHTEIDREINQEEKVFTWSANRLPADVKIREVKPDDKNTRIHAVYNNTEYTIEIPHLDKASIENAIHCLVLMLYLNKGKNIPVERFKNLAPVAMRLQLKKGINQCAIVNDSYNADLASLNIALDFLNMQQQYDKRTVVLSDILQSGQTEETLYKEVSELIASQKISRFIGVGEALSRQQKSFSNAAGESLFFKSTEDFLKNIESSEFQNEILLIKGARPYQFEKISKILEQQVHETVMEIDLNSLENNLNVYHSFLKPDTRMMLMVKAFSYGIGTYEIANFLQFQRETYLGVAYTDEGVALRKAGITMPVMVMNPEWHSFPSVIKYHLEPEIYSFRQLDVLNTALQDQLVVAENLPLPVHIKLDTGMHRLGFTESDIPELIQKIKANPTLKIASVFSHLAAADEHEEEEFSQDQIRKYERWSEKIIQELGSPVIRHILNSAGIISFKDAQYDMVRLGIGLYGIDTTGKIQDKLEPVSTLKASIAQIKELDKGETIGYSRNGVMKKAGKTATISIGYADGIDMRLGNGRGKVIIKGQEAPLIGNICMDMCMADITGLENIEEGDEVIFFGKELPVQKVAERIGTIPYEILTGVSQRVKRIYVQE